MSLVVHFFWNTVQKAKNGCHGNVPYVQGIGDICIRSADHSNLPHNRLVVIVLTILVPKIGYHGNIPQHLCIPI